MFNTLSTNSTPFMDRMKEGRITYSSMHACARKVEWLSTGNGAPTGRGECKPVEVPLVTVETGSPFRKIGEEVTCAELR